MLSRLWFFVCFLLLRNTFALGVSELPEFVVDEDYLLVPYHRIERNLSFLGEVVNDPKVYPMIRHGKLWDESLLLDRHRAYIEGNQSFEMGNAYNSADFTVCWLLIDRRGEAVGRGGFQPQDCLGRAETEIFFAIKGDYQRKGLGRAVFKALSEWFERLFAGSTLLWLSVSDNIPSLRIANRLEFQPVLESDGHQQKRIMEWERIYVVLRKSQTRRG